MPNESIPICGCGVALDMPKGTIRNGALIPSKKYAGSKTTSGVAKWDNRGGGGGGGERKHQNQRVEGGGEFVGQGPASAFATLETGSTSSVLHSEQWRINEKHNGKQGKRLNSSRRTRSAERPDTTHYTYIDSGSSIVGNGIRENVIPEALYATVNGSPNRTANPSLLSGNNQPSNGQNNQSQPVYAIPSMTSPPPTYDVAMWQSGLPPSYEEYLCHKYAVISRSHTPPPPWSDSAALGNGQQLQQSRREILASQPDLREYLSQLAKAHAHAQAQSQSQSQSQNNNQTSSRHQLRIMRESNSGTIANSNSQISRDQAARSQRARTTISRSQSESRARQQRIATMYEDGAFCMETTAIQSAFEHGVAFCSLM